MPVYHNNNFNKNSTRYKMIDIGHKNLSYRRACVYGSIYVGKDVFSLIKNKCIEKGDPLILAEIAGINAAKKTSELLTLCHQINIDNIFFNIEMDEDNYSIYIYCIISAFAKTGVEMEAMTGVNIALLTIYDLTKKFNPFIFIKNIKLLYKDGGENGLVLGSIHNIPIHLRHYFLNTSSSFKGISIILITISDRASVGIYKNISGQVLFDFFKIRSANIITQIIIPDDKNIIKNILKKCVIKYNPNIILTSGGTGLSHRDITSSVLYNLIDKDIPGIGEYLRQSGAAFSNTSWLSRTMAGIYKKSLLVSLPGNPSGVCESLNILQPLLLHAIKIINKL